MMDVNAPSFHKDFTTFKDVIKELEHRLGALIVQVMPGCCLPHAGHSNPSGIVSNSTCWVSTAMAACWLVGQPKTTVICQHVVSSTSKCLYFAGL